MFDLSDLKFDLSESEFELSGLALVLGSGLFRFSSEESRSANLETKVFAAASAFFISALLGAPDDSDFFESSLDVS